MRHAPDILIIAAVHEEIAPLVQELAAPEMHIIGGRRLYAGHLKDVPVRLLVTGPGMVNTAQGLTAAIAAARPMCIVMTGCGGGFAAAGMRVGDLAVAEREVDIQIGIEPDMETQAVRPLPFSLGGESPGDRPGSLSLDSALARSAFQCLDRGFREESVRVRKGVFITVSTVTATDGRAARLFDRHRPVMENMEGQAAAQVAAHYKIPMIEIRAASNIVGKRDRDRWDIPLACSRSAMAVAALLDSDLFGKEET